MSYHSIADEMSYQIHYVIGRSGPWFSISNVWSKSPDLRSLAPGHLRKGAVPGSVRILSVCEVI